VGNSPAMILDGSGHPVIAYWDSTNTRLEVAFGWGGAAGGIRPDRKDPAELGRVLPFALSFRRLRYGSGVGRVPVRLGL
jgi:hypothetical protein